MRFLAPPKGHCCLIKCHQHRKANLFLSYPMFSHHLIKQQEALEVYTSKSIADSVLSLLGNMIYTGIYTGCTVTVHPSVATVNIVFETSVVMNGTQLNNAPCVEHLLVRMKWILMIHYRCMMIQIQLLQH